MTDLTKVLMYVVATGMLATVLSKKAQTPKVLDSVFGGFSKLEGTVMGYAKN